MLARKALAGTAGAPKEYVEDVFSTYLYTGTGSNQTITNNIDLSGKGGLVYLKSRSAIRGSALYDTARGATYLVESASTNAATEEPTGLTSFSSTGFAIGTATQINTNGTTYVSWTFRKAKKFFDVVTYTGNGSNRTISHNLGSVPGSIWVKRTDTTGAWAVYHRSLANTEYLVLNTTAAKATGTTYWNSTTPTSTEFSLGTATDVNANGGTYVAYLFAHDAGGFGDAGSDSIIKCGSFTTNGSGAATVTLDWEPQWLLVKASSTSEDWNIGDNMRGMPNGDTAQTTGLKWLKANNTDAEAGQNTNNWYPTATGFKVTDIGYNNATFVYIAIRRGPMKTPTSGTSVFYPKVHAGTSSYSVGFPTDLCLAADQSGNALNTVAVYRLAGNNAYFGGTASTAAEVSVSVCQFDLRDSFQLSYNNNNQARWHFRRAPGFFDVVCWTGTGSNIDVTHSLGVTPEFIIGKSRSDGFGWICYHKDIGSTGGYPNYLVLNSTQASGSGASTIWRGVSSTTFSYGTNATLNSSGSTYVAYLFASVSGVSKVGSYTGNGSSVTVTTGFQPRFILVKRTDSTGNWIVSDSARGLVAGNDPYLLLNSTAAEDTDEDWVDVSSTGFTVNETSAANANVNTGTYIYLAIA